MFAELSAARQEAFKLLAPPVELEDLATWRPMIVANENSPNFANLVRHVQNQFNRPAIIRHTSLFTDKAWIAGQTPDTPLGATAFGVADNPNKTDGPVFSIYRGQLNKGETVRYETNAFYFNSALFPVVMRWTENNAGRALPLAMRVCYSSFEPTSGDPKALLFHKANFVPFQLRDSRGAPTNETAYIDTTLIGDNNCLLSILAAVENSFAKSGCYIFMYPEVDRELYNQPGTPFADPRTHKITGPSLGMAVFAAVSGWPPLMYTGYISYLAPGFKLVHGSNTASAEWLGKPPATTNVAANYSVSSLGAVKVAKQLNFVDQIQDLHIKIVFALVNKIPFVFPLSSSLGESTAEFLMRNDNRNYMTAVLGIMPQIYTMSAAQDGIPDGTGGNIHNLYAGSTVTEFQHLALIATFGKLSVRPGNAQTEAFTQAVIQRKLNLGQAAAAAFQQRRAEDKKLLAEYDDGKIDKDQYIKEKKTIVIRRKQKSEAKKQERKKKAKAASEKKQQARQDLKEIEAAYKKAFEEAKANLGPRPSKEDRKAFNKAFPKPAALKRKLNRGKIAEIFNATLPVADRHTDPTNLQKGLRKHWMKVLRSEDVDDAAIIQIMNKKFTKLPRLPTDLDMDAFLDNQAPKQRTIKNYTLGLGGAPVQASAVDPNAAVAAAPPAATVQTRPPPPKLSLMGRHAVTYQVDDTPLQRGDQTVSDKRARAFNINRSRFNADDDEDMELELRAPSGQKRRQMETDEEKKNK